ncbi:hypothetical protein K502DRAFT_362887 [Neoconidiobolus thromboides FSU 785]|nr:hypothetical protein K502DRAFT_362887 [Neoconidiobolus thromboides FSU 785]
MVLKYAYYIVPLILSLVLSILPVVLGEIIFTSGEGSTCWFNEDETSGFVWAYAVNYAWILFSIIFCTFVFATVSFNLFYEKYKLNTSFDKKTVTNVNKCVIIRLLMFSLIPIVCYIVLVFRLLFGKSFTFDQEFQTSIASSFFKGLQGFFNASLFLYNSLLYKEAEKAITKVVRSSKKAIV